MTTTENTPEPRLSARSFERNTCWKCDGTGTIRGFAHVMGGTCFSCNGTGGRLTARGTRQMAAYDAAIIIPVADVAAGDKVNLGSLTGRVVVESVEHHADGRTTLHGSRLKSAGNAVSYTALPESTTRRVLTRAAMNELVTRCLAIR